VKQPVPHATEPWRTWYARVMSFIKNAAGMLLLFLLAVSLAACNQRQAQAQPVSAVAAPVVEDVKEFRSFSLTIYGYNYTDTEIGSFEVNSKGGGNLAVSTPTSAGGSSVCCAAVFTPIPKDRPFTIKWTRDGDTWCEQDVQFTGPVPSNADILEVHFYQDGHIELAATAKPSKPRLKMDRLHGNSRHADPSKNVINDTKHSRCKLGYF
jgi:Protein of unknown function (DUF3304)